MADKLTIQIVEDEALIAEGLKCTLEDLGYEVTGIAYTFGEARQTLLTTQADLTLLDINLGSGPTADGGLALARLLTEVSPRPFLFLTAYSDQATIREATRLRPVGYLIKPVNPATLFAAIQTAIEGYIQHQHPTPDGGTPQAEPDFFFVKVGNRTVRLRWEEVWCLVAGKNYVQVRVSDGRIDYLIRGTLQFVTRQLVPTRLRPLFWQVNRNTCVNRTFITGHDAESVFCGAHQLLNTRIPLRDLAQLRPG